MESPDSVVDTSDVEEREDFVFSIKINTPIHSVHADIDASPQRALVTRRDRPSDDEEEYSSPRKRAKVAHDTGSTSPGSVHSATAEVAFLNDTPPDVHLEEQIPDLNSIHSPQRISMIQDEQPAPMSFPPCDVSPRSDYHSLFSASLSKHDSPVTTHRARSPSVESSPRSLPLSRSPSRSLSISTDHFSLFSSPHCRPTTPPQTSSQHSHDPCSSVGRKPRVVPSSPLTPVSSPGLLAQTLSQSPDPLELLPPRLSPDSHPASPANPPPAIPHPVRSPPVVIPEDSHPLGRYALRRREARQLNPYAYDKLVYKQQLKLHPDAIVKHRSPRRRYDSGGVGEAETQDEYVFNADEDDDYVESVKKRRAANVDHNEEDEGGLEEVWLPETLERLPSSDEDEDESRKLARSIRRTREIAEAIARGEARRAAADARQAEKGTKKKKWRPRPFPVDGEAEHASTYSLEHVPAHEQLPSSSQISRVYSEPTMASYPPPSLKSPSRPPAPSRASSHSTFPSFNPPRSPDFYVQQDDSFGFDDHGASPRNVSPIDLSVNSSAPPSPSGPPTTSGASALPSNTSGLESESESESDQSSTHGMTSKDRKRLRVLRRMMPAAMIAQQFGGTKGGQRPPPRARDAVGSSGSEAEEARLVPGHARVRQGRYRDVEIKGDPESSDIEPPMEVYDDAGMDDVGLGATELFSDGQSVRSRRSPRLGHGDDVIFLSDNSSTGSSEDSESEGGDDEMAHRSLFDRPAKGPSHERSLIDWMLTRTRNTGKRKTKSKKPTGSRKSRGSGVPKFDVVTRGARRHGQPHQTRLPFARIDTVQSTTSSTKRSSENRNRNPQLERDTTEEGKRQKKKQKRQPRTNQGLVYNVNHDATHIRSKHHKARMVIEDEEDELRQALDPGWKAEIERWNRSVSPVRRPAAGPAPSVPAAPRPRLVHRRASPPRQPQHESPLPCYFRRQAEPFALARRGYRMDMNINLIPSGVKFSASTYVGKGFLYELVSVTSGSSEVAPPVFCNVRGLEIGPTTSAAVFKELLGPLFDGLTSALRDFKVDDTDTMKEWESVTRSASQLFSWLVVHTEDQDFAALKAALREYSDTLLLVLESLGTTVFSLSIHWFLVELSARLATGIKYRQGTVEDIPLIQSAKQLIQCLLDIDLQPAFTTFHAADGDVDDTSLPHRAAELWVCLIHLLPSVEISPEAPPGHPLWRLLAQLHPESSATGPEASESLWRTLFNLCAISQFSPHGLSTSIFRLPAAWELVSVALKKIILTSNPENERRLLERTLKLRDDYISLVVSRCFHLWSRWKWRLDDGIAMFKSLQEIFRSRNFANLLHERPALMGFIEHGDLELLSKRDPDDPVFEIFLKMVVQAVYQLDANVELDSKHRLTNIKKLLQLAVPVSPVPFSRSAPPSQHTLSMLVNRFSAMAIAVHLDPTTPNVKFRISQAKRCVTFKDADDDSRVACAYGMMNLAMIIRHHKIVGGLEEVLGWLGEMTDVLMDEYKEEDAGSIKKQRIITLIQLLIGSVRRLVETPSLNKGPQPIVEYPDPALLDGPWVTRVFNPRTDLITIQRTGFEIRMLVQSFLSARLKVVPGVRPPPPPIVHSVESQESQDEYDQLFLDLKDEELLAALGDEAEASVVAELKSKEDALCKVLDKFITPAVYRLVCKQFGEREHAKIDATRAGAADEWIDCWVGCANVLVQNNYKEWGLYMKLGQQSWEKIIDDSWRRRVGLRFNLTLLRLDPGAYSKMKNEFIAVLLVAMLSYRTTIEHEFMSVVLSLDGLQHPLLRAAPIDPLPGTRTYDVTRANYEDVRDQLIESVLQNAAGCLRAKADAESQAYVELVVMMLSTMRDIYRETAEAREEYGGFCQNVFRMLLSYPELVSHPRTSDVLAWGRREWDV